MVRQDFEDQIYLDENDKFEAIAAEIAEEHAKGRPMLIGTTSIAKSEKLSAELKKLDVPHNVLNAKHHEREADIVAQAGRKGSVTVATNMAGRGTDIVLGGNPELLWRDELAAKELEPETSASRGVARRDRRGLQGRTRDDRRVGWAVRDRDGATRGAPHRQPASGSLWAPGRSG